MRAWQNRNHPLSAACDAFSDPLTWCCMYGLRTWKNGGWLLCLVVRTKDDVVEFLKANTTRAGQTNNWGVSPDPVASPPALSVCLCAPIFRYFWFPSFRKSGCAPLLERLWALFGTNLALNSLKTARKKTNSSKTHTSSLFFGSSKVRLLISVSTKSS